MEIIGRGTGPADHVVWEADYLSVSALMGLASRLEATERGEQFLFREVELDCAFGQADSRHQEAVRSNDPMQVARALAVRDLVFEIHDLCGLRSMKEAVSRVNVLAEVVAGIG
jgi:hypothetical protein